MGKAEILVDKQTEVISQVIIYITVHRQKARELSASTQARGQNQKVQYIDNHKTER